MGDRDREDLTELLARFFNSEEAQGMIADMQAGDQVLQDNPAPGPDAQLLDRIKADGAVRLAKEKMRRSRHRTQSRVAAAAAVVISAGVFVLLFNAGPEPGELATGSGRQSDGHL